MCDVDVRVPVVQILGHYNHPKKPLGCESITNEEVAIPFVILGKALRFLMDKKVSLTGSTLSLIA